MEEVKKVIKGHKIRQDEKHNVSGWAVRALFTNGTDTTFLYTVVKKHVSAFCARLLQSLIFEQFWLRDLCLGEGNGYGYNLVRAGLKYASALFQSVAACVSFWLLYFIHSDSQCFQS